ncbi:DNA polymerase III subunit gamma/tau [Sulfurimonas sp.]|uniref:DNA polymerase III subunit gamma/tau n=1 Tax=Sulfurimonas sp. TaxID=2022749 RepID=UPI002B492D45|nr:DNA polymerase III subunit gamma/tau [Sulfurimonas sp.]
MKESSEVLARKYRPSTFDELIGQETISQTLSLALDSNRLSHAYLFSGLRGSGKTSTARIFAKALICEEGMSHQPCGVCSNCVSALQNRHIDIIEMDAASNRGIDDIKSLVEQTKYKPSSARFKVIIIDEVHMLSTPAFNALLKTLEEPPEYVKFILATTDPLKLPATILSRTQHFRFKRIATNKVIDHLAHILNLEKIGYEHDALEILARSGSGSLRDTLTLLDQAIIYSKNHVDVNTVTDMLGLVDPKFITDLFNAVFAKDYAQLVEYTKVLEDYEAEMVVDELIAYLKERMYNQDALFSTLVLDRFFRILSDSKYLFSINADGSFVLSMIFFKMIEALRIKEVDQMIESLQKEIQRPQEIIKPQETVKATTEVKEASSIQEPIQAEAKKEEVVTPLTNQKFDELIASIKDRNNDLGICFEKSITFVSFEDGLLTWESCPDEEAKKALKHGWGAIQHLVKEAYGFQTKIKGNRCTKASVPEPQEPEPSSMVEEAEIGGSGSCVTNCSSTDESTKEVDSNNIKDEPMVQKAIEMFEATKITIQSKI